MVRLENVTFSYSQKPVLSALDLTVPEGDFCAIVGPNGSGKTTLLKLMAGLLKPQQGRVSTNGKNIAGLSPMEMAKMISYVPQHQDVVFDFTVFDTVMMGRNPYQNRWTDASESDVKVVREVLEQTGLAHLSNRMLSHLSGGECQRVMIARAMAQQTPVMLLDEPLSNLDVGYRFEVMDVLRELNRKQHATVIIILHDFSFVSQYATSTLMLHGNGEHRYGTTREILNNDHIRHAFGLSDDYHLDDKGHVFRDEAPFRNS
ncbi:MAG: ABC transporter ATP-binding protein [Bacteroidales bacterium]|nr:ABC transporter ATP-binding protein [Bacteroidales bacterium]